MTNVTLFSELPPLPLYTTTPRPPLLAPISDQVLVILLPVAAYWIFSLFFHYIDTYDCWPQYRLHTPAEVLKRNHVSRREVVRDVIIQQALQIVVCLGLVLIDPPATFGSERYDVAVWAQRIRASQAIIPRLLSVLGVDSMTLGRQLASYPQLAGMFLGGQYPFSRLAPASTSSHGIVVPDFAQWEHAAASAIYWVMVPALQFAVAILFLDTWQYFWHRALHMNQALYRKFHSRHHLLYVPYAYGALYNHPLEGLVLDTFGASLAYLVAGMSTRQGMWLFTCSTLKTVDDHCGYALPWDPLQHLTSNNAGYHDIHHQSWGIKTNFSQPFFTFWDRLLGTAWTGGDVSARYERSRKAAQQKYDQDSQVPLSSDKAAKQILESQEQVLQDHANGGARVLLEERAEEREAEKMLRQTPRKRTISSASQAGSLKSFTDKVQGSFHGRGGTILGLESSG